MKIPLISVLALFALAPSILGQSQNFVLPTKKGNLPLTKVPAVKLKIKDLSGVDRIVHLGGSEGHGGDFKEMAISNIAWELLDQLEGNTVIDLEGLKTVVENLKLEVVDEVRLGELKRDAVNIPDQNKIYLSDEAYLFITNKKIDFPKRAQFLLHELLPIIGVDDKNYQTSSDLSLTMKNERSEIQSHHNLLFSYNFGADFDGVSYEEAKDVCESVKQAHKKEYFAVYCSYQEKFAERYVVDWRYRGSYSYIPWDFYLEGPIYGLKVVGYGDLDQLKEVSIIDGHIDDMPTYLSRSQAIYECTKIVAREDDTNFDYYNAKCEAFSFEDGYRFSIKTKNPKLQ